MIAFLEKIGICPGDKVAILSTNMPNWGVVFFSITFMGAVAVPVLPDFSNKEVGNVLEHSGAKAIFVSTSLLPGLKDLNLKILRQLFLLRIIRLSFLRKIFKI